MANPLHDNPRSKEVADDDAPKKKAFVKKPNYKVGDTEYENVDPDSRKGMGGDEEFAGEISRTNGKGDITESGTRFYHYRRNEDGTKSKDMYAPVREEKPNS